MKNNEFLSFCIVCEIVVYETYAHIRLGYNVKQLSYGVKKVFAGYGIVQKVINAILRVRGRF